MSSTVPVTVVVPAFNAAPYLEVTLQSLKDQTTAPERIVVVDDGSTDGTPDIAERLGVECVRQPNSGPGAARNRGLAAVETPLVAFLDADDWYAPGKLERSVAHLFELGAACVATDAWVVRGDRVDRRKNDRRPVPVVLTLEMLLRGNPVICSTVVARTEAVRTAGGFDEDPELVATEDYDLWLRMSMREPLSYMPEPMTFYRAHTGSLSANPRFLRGVDSILDRIAMDHRGEAHFENLIRRRRADVRLDVAWDLIANGRRAEARALIAEAHTLHRSWKGLRMQLRSLMPR